MMTTKCQHHCHLQIPACVSPQTTTSVTSFNTNEDEKTREIVITKVTLNEVLTGQRSVVHEVTVTVTVAVNVSWQSVPQSTDALDFKSGQIQFWQNFWLDFRI